MVSVLLATLLLLTMILYLREQKAQQRRRVAQRDVPREELLPRHYKSFVEVENKLWAATDETERWSWDTGSIPLRPPEARLVREYVQGLRKDFAQANRIFSVVIGRSPDAETLKQMEVHRLKLELPYCGLCMLVRFRLGTHRVSLAELRRLTDLVATMALEVRSMLNILEQAGHTELVEALIRKY